MFHLLVILLSLSDSTGGSYRCKTSPSCCYCQKPNFLLLKDIPSNSRIPSPNVWKLDIVLRNSSLDFPFARRKKIIQVMKTHRGEQIMTEFTFRNWSKLFFLPAGGDLLSQETLMFRIAYYHTTHTNSPYYIC